MKTHKFMFESVNDWKVCTCAPGAREIKPEVSDTQVYLITTTRGRVISGYDACAEWLSKHPDTLHAYNLWREAREREVQAWKHATPHHRYDCDGGCLAVRVNGVKIMVGNGLGDGNYPVYVMRNSLSFNCDEPAPDVLPHTFRSTGTSLESDTPMKVEILDYDCADGRPIETFSAESVEFFVDGEGAVVVKYVED